MAFRLLTSSPPRNRASRRFLHCACRPIGAAELDRVQAQVAATAQVRVQSDAHELQLRYVVLCVPKLELREEFGAVQIAPRHPRAVSPVLAIDGSRTRKLRSSSSFASCNAVMW